MKSRVDPPLLVTRNTAAVTSLILGLVGIPAMVGDPAFGLVFGLAAVGLGAVGVRKTRTTGSGRAVAVAGIALGVVTLVAFVIFAVLISNDSLARPIGGSWSGP